MKKLSILLILLSFCAVSVPSTHAQNNAIDQEPEEEEVFEIRPLDQYIYEKPTMDKLSQLYWALSTLDIDKDENIDNFLRINECDIFKDYYHHEFEWVGVRDAGRKFIEENKKTFPLRFQFTHQIKLGEYDMEEGVFKIPDEYKVEGIRRFYVQAVDADEDICGLQYDIPNYPDSIVLELSRPFLFNELPMPREEAEKFITEKMEEMKGLKTHLMTEENVFNNRNAYIVMKVKLFTVGPDVKVEAGVVRPSFLGVLEGFEVYTDPDLNNLVLSKSYRMRRKATPVEDKLKAEYEAQKAQEALENPADAEEQPAEEVE